MTLQRATLVLVLACASPSWAQEATPAVVHETKVEVSGVKDPALRPYRIMSRGLDAFEKHHALAPGASLRFELKNKDGTQLPAAGVSLRLSGDKVDLALPVDGNATFVLPRSQEAFDDNADLVVNRKNDVIRWRPYVRSPGVPESTRRLGDLRLECEVAWAVMRDEIGFVMRTAMAAVGGMCHAPMSALYYRAPGQLAAVRLTSGERSRFLTLSADRHSYIVPVRAKEWDNESLIVYEFAPEPDAAPTETPQTTQGAAAP
ncbi:hypothetical protein AB2N08_11040 [Massilia aurea]|uniref:hypothetical protein n=1 Tax=Massilia aurea TaxID=373040 RepID=UPI0034625CBD